jgi:hypothetical protein
MAKEKSWNDIRARLLPGNADALTPYKRIIARAVCPAFEKDQDVSLSTGKKAISDYKKATGDVAGTLELMVWYIECGHIHFHNPVPAGTLKVRVALDCFSRKIEWKG